MSLEGISWAFKQDLPCAHKFVLVALGDHANWDAECWPSQKALSEKCGLSRQHVNKVLGDLERDGYVTITDRPRKNGADSSCCYILSIPDDDRRRPVSPGELPAHTLVTGFVYVIQDGDRCKIGISRDVEKRLKALSGACGKKLKIAAAVACKMQTARKVEQQAHEAFAAHREHGEWFHISAREAVAFIEEGVSTETTPPVSQNDTPVSTETTPPVNVADTRTTEPSLNQPKEPALKGAAASPPLPGFASEPVPQAPPKNAKAKNGNGHSPSELPDWIPTDAWAGFVEMRKIKHPMTKRAAELIVKDLDRLRTQGHDPGDVLDQSTKNCWRGVFELKGELNGQGNHKASGPDALTRGAIAAAERYRNAQAGRRAQ